MAALDPETAAQRFVRDWATIVDDRETRDLKSQKLERVQRIYVNAADGTSPATAGNTNP